VHRPRLRRRPQAARLLLVRACLQPLTLPASPQSLDLKRQSPPLPTLVPHWPPHPVMSLPFPHAPARCAAAIPLPALSFTSALAPCRSGFTACPELHLRPCPMPQRPHCLPLASLPPLPHAAAASLPALSFISAPPPCRSKMCLKNRHGEDIAQAEASGCWLCPPCRGSCGEGCTLCCNCGPCRKKVRGGPHCWVRRAAATLNPLPRPGVPWLPSVCNSPTQSRGAPAIPCRA
jgi:hypothetical protein